MFFEIRRIEQKKSIFYFGLNLILLSLQNHDETHCVSEQFCEKEWI